jgi:hypothetical protein
MSDTTPQSSDRVAPSYEEAEHFLTLLDARPSASRSRPSTTTKIARTIA